MNEILERLSLKYSKHEYLGTDPIQIPHSYSIIQDKEIVGFISALFSYGNVKAILNHLTNLLNLLGKNPSKFLSNTQNINQIQKHIPSYRFQTSQDIYQFLYILGILWKQSYTLELFFTSQGNERILEFQKKFWNTYSEYYTTKPSYGLRFLIGSENPKSPHKRYWMFLRWMVRKEYPDFGIYKSISPCELLYPLDIHIQKFANVLGLSNRKTNDITKVIEITNALSKLAPLDPVKYDFPLSRLGILKECKGYYHSKLCPNCDLKSICHLSKKVNLQ